MKDQKEWILCQRNETYSQYTHITFIGIESGAHKNCPKQDLERELSN